MSYPKKSTLFLCIAISILGIGIFCVGMNKTSIATSGNTFQDTRIVYCGNDGLYTLRLDEVKPTRLIAGENICRPIISKAGNAVAFQHGDSLFVYDFASKNTMLLMNDVYSYCKGPMDTFIASSIEKGIVSFNISGEATVLVEPVNESQYKKEYGALSLSNDNTLLTYSSLLLEGSYAYSEGVWLYHMSSNKKELIVSGRRSTEDTIGEAPEPGKWSKDSQNLFIWLRPASASLTADGVFYGLYNVDSKQLIKEEDYALTYNENVNLLDNGSILLLSGSDRMMYQNKTLKTFDIAQTPHLHTIATPNLVPAMSAPCNKADIFYFIASHVIPSNTAVDPFPIQRQLYSYQDGTITAITKDNTYRDDYVALFNNEAHLMLGRIGANGEYSLWLMDTGNNKLRQIANWSYSELNDQQNNGYYGRTDWSWMFDLYQ